MSTGQCVCVMFLHYSALHGLDACLAPHLDIDIVMNTQQLALEKVPSSCESGQTGTFTLYKQAFKDIRRVVIKTNLFKGQIDVIISMLQLRNPSIMSCIEAESSCGDSTGASWHWSWWCSSSASASSSPTPPPSSTSPRRNRRT